MDLKELSAPLPKPWLNVNVNSLNVSSGAVSALAYSQFVPVTVTNTTVPTSLTTVSPGGFVGSLTIPVLAWGSHIRASIPLINFQLTAGHAITFSVSVNGVKTAIFGHAPGGGGWVAPLNGYLKIDLSQGPAGITAAVEFLAILPLGPTGVVWDVETQPITGDLTLGPNVVDYFVTYGTADPADHLTTGNFTVDVLQTNYM